MAAAIVEILLILRRYFKVSLKSAHRIRKVEGIEISDGIPKIGLCILKVVICLLKKGSGVDDHQ